MHGQPEESCGRGALPLVRPRRTAMGRRRGGGAPAADVAPRERLPCVPAGPGSAAGGRGVEVASGSGTSSAGGIEDGSEGAVELAASRAGLSTHEYQSGTGVEPDAEGEADGALFTPVDLACVVVRAFAPFRTRMPAMGGRPARFRRARWLRVLPADGGEPFTGPTVRPPRPLPARARDALPEEPTGPEPPDALPPRHASRAAQPDRRRRWSRRPPGRRRLELRLGLWFGLWFSLRLSLRLSLRRGGLLHRPAASPRPGTAPERLVMLASAPGLRVLLADVTPRGGGGTGGRVRSADDVRSEVFDEVSAMWLAEGRQTWKSALRADLLPARGRSPRAVE